MKLYDPDKCSTFKMQFGFEQPLKYIPNTRKQIRKEIRYENYRNKIRRSKKSI